MNPLASLSQTIGVDKGLAVDDDDCGGRGECAREGEDSEKGSTYYKLNVKSPRMDALSSISMSRFASSDSFKPSVSPALPPPNTSL
jgi:hypothetical protein